MGRRERGWRSLEPGPGAGGRGRREQLVARLFPEPQDSNAHVDGTTEVDAKETISWLGRPVHRQLTLFQLAGPPGAGLGKCGLPPGPAPRRLGWGWG